MLMWFRKVGFQQLIHKGFFLSDVGRRDVYCVNELRRWSGQSSAVGGLQVGSIRLCWEEVLVQCWE